MYKENTPPAIPRSPLSEGGDDASFITRNSWLPERDILIRHGDRRTRAILAIMAARRSSGRQIFFVAPHIAEFFDLAPRDLNWALDALDGTVVQTLNSRQGKFRRMSLLPEWEEQVATKSKNHPQQSSSVVTAKPTATVKWNEIEHATSILDDPKFQQVLISASREHQQRQ